MIAVEIGSSRSLAASPAAIMILRLSVNRVDLQRSRQMLSLLQCQPTAAQPADLMNADDPIRSNLFQHDPPLHPELPATKTERSHSTPTFRTASWQYAT